ncbi:hypothetical protein KIW84_061802 [Lathyrus oleraceus]|uniref:Uncharacterized protein n=1 Tax=Pisum sativum TaxID=3888 RepID=A0A9D5A2T4_PEA|nr:hypothetical protein KIW84_061802 [Pisum sativum]
MADDTRSKAIDEGISHLTTNQTSLTNSQTLLASKIDDILGKLSSLDTSSHSPGNGSPSYTSPQNSNKPHWSALGWFQWMSRNGQLTSWAALLHICDLDYNDLSMKFLKNGKMIELRGERDGGLQLITTQ